MTNDTSVNGLPCEWERVGDGKYAVTITRGSRGGAEHKLHVGQHATFTYCDHSEEGVIVSIQVRDM